MSLKTLKELMPAAVVSELRTFGAEKRIGTAPPCDFLFRKRQKALAPFVKQFMSNPEECIFKKDPTNLIFLDQKPTNADQGPASKSRKKRWQEMAEKQG